MSAPIELTQASFDANFNLVDPRRKPKTVVLIYRPTCHFCNLYKPDYIAASKSCGPDTVFAMINTDAHPAFLQSLRNAPNAPFKVKGVPHIVGYNNGKYYSTYVDSRDGKVYRSIEDTLEYADGIGSAMVEIRDD